PAVLVTEKGPELLGGGSVLGAWKEANVERHERTLRPTDTLALCTDGWLEAGPIATHQGPETFAEMTQALAGLELEELTERLRADAVGRSAGTLRDDLVVLAVRPRATSEDAEAPGELTVGAT
ncbi:MAG TPA: SpoIIE family protein phosphatase, partial [Solirubrobacterales bacterium]|nr:SpoIIE family protein phosphatase [Solirubrobacterales bacterium]